jgi:hypothetical protein
MDPKEVLEDLKKQAPARARVLIQLVLQREADKLMPNWRAEQLIKFIGLIDWFAEDLEDAYEKERVMTVSWLARNLLEAKAASATLRV